MARASLWDRSKTRPVPQPKTVFGKAAQALWVVTGPKVDALAFGKRMEICNACPLKKVKDGVSYCGKCGCGTWWKKARLDEKLWFARLKCPLGKFDAEGGA